MSVTGINVTGTDAGNYTFNTTAATTANITKAALTVTVNPENKLFGTPDPTLTYTNSGLVGTDVITGNLTRNPGESAGSYAITQGTVTGGSNYNLVYVGNFLSINTAGPGNFFNSLFQDSLGRPIISVADKVINFYAPFEPHQTQTLNVDVSLKLQNPQTGGNGHDGGNNLANIEPAAGGGDGQNPGNLANIEPAAGGHNGPKNGSENGNFVCANDFLDGKACTDQ